MTDFGLNSPKAFVCLKLHTNIFTVSELLSVGFSVGYDLVVNVGEVELAHPRGRGRGPVGVVIAARLDPLRAQFRVVQREREVGELGPRLALAEVDRTLNHVYKDSAPRKRRFDSDEKRLSAPSKGGFLEPVLVGVAR